jgi:hypothetical protein
MGSYVHKTYGKKNTLFSLDKCFNKRVLFCNESSFEQCYEDNMLMLHAGDPISEQDKYMVLHK